MNKFKKIIVWIRGKKDNDWQLSFLNRQDNILVKSNIDMRIKSNTPIILSPLGSIFVSEKQITLKELDQIQQVYKQHSADHNILTPEVQPSRHILFLITKIFDHI